MSRWQSDEGRGYRNERWRQERRRADLNRARQHDTDPDDVEVGEGDRVRPAPGPSELSGLLGDIVRARGWDRHLRTASLHESWDDIVGPQLARVSRPGRLRGGVLHVVVAEPRWATQLQYMVDQLSGRVTAETGIEVDEVRVVVGDLDA